MRRISLILSLVMALLLITSSVVGQDSFSTKSRARVRAEPNTTSTIIATLRGGTPLTVLGTVDGSTVSGSKTWYQVSVNAQVGYIHSSLVKTSTPTQETPATGNTSDATQSTAPQPAQSTLSCGTCSQMASCEQAYACLNAGYQRLDRDHDGVPCESICPGG